MRTTTDMTALIISFTSMLEQLHLARRVCKEWKGLIDRHPLLLRDVDLGDPIRFPVDQVDSILDLSGFRVRSLRICVRDNPLINKFRSPVEFVLINSVVKVIRNLERISLVGHINPGAASLLTLLKSSTSTTVHLQLESCGCCLNRMEKLKTETNTRPGAKLSLSCPLGQFFVVDNPLYVCDRCFRQVQWASFCSKCKTIVCCSECSFYWRWPGEFRTSHTDCCRCEDCNIRATHPVTPIFPPLWSCTVHCRAHDY